MSSANTLKRLAKGFAILVIIAAVAAVGIGLAVVISPCITFAKDLAAQQARLDELRVNPGAPVNEQQFASFDLSGSDEIKFNEIQTLITHNSYKKDISKLNYIAMKPFTGVEGSHYEHDTLTNQLNNGVRGFELDVQYHNGEFWIYHIPVKDSSSQCPDWELALEELKIWSDNNPGHLPVSMLIEVKKNNLSSGAVKKLDESILSVMGKDKLITPSLLMGENSTLRNVAANNDWISLSKAMGKFMFMLHPADCTDRFIALDPTLGSQVMVPMFTTEIYDAADPRYTDYFLLFKNDKLDVDRIRAFVNSGFMVRTRMDGPCDYQEGNQQLAVRTGAQIISTDYEPGVILPKVDYHATLGEGKTVVLIGQR